MCLPGADFVRWWEGQWFTRQPVWSCCEAGSHVRKLQPGHPPTSLTLHPPTGAPPLTLWPLEWVGRAGWQALARIHFGRSCCPHTEWSADCSAEHKRPEASIASPCGPQACVEMLASVLLETVAVYLPGMAMAPHFIPYMSSVHFKQSSTLNSSLPTASSPFNVMHQPAVKAFDHGDQLIQWAFSSVIMRSVKVNIWLTDWVITLVSLYFFFSFKESFIKQIILDNDWL